MFELFYMINVIIELRIGQSVHDISCPNLPIIGKFNCTNKDFDVI